MGFSFSTEFSLYALSRRDSLIQCKNRKTCKPKLKFDETLHHCYRLFCANTLPNAYGDDCDYSCGFSPASVMKFWVSGWNAKLRSLSLSTPLFVCACVCGIVCVCVCACTHVNTYIGCSDRFRHLVHAIIYITFAKKKIFAQCLPASNYLGDANNNSNNNNNTTLPSFRAKTKQTNGKQKRRIEKGVLKREQTPRSLWLGTYKQPGAH